MTGTTTGEAPTGEAARHRPPGLPWARAVSDRRPAGKSRKGRANAPTARRAQRKPVWLSWPALGLLGVIVVIPAMLDFYMSFLGVNASTLGNWATAPFVGFANYSSALTTESVTASSALQALWVSIEFAVLSTIITTPIAFVIALAVHNRFVGRGLFRSLFLVPFVVPTVVTAIGARLAFANGTGLVDRAISALHIGSLNTYWLIGPRAFWAMLLTEVWSVWPFIYIMTLAGLSGVDPDLFEAAVVDGAGYVGKIRHVVIPQVRTVVLLGMLLATIFHLGNFTLPFVMFGQAPPANVSVLPLDIYFRAFGDFTYSLAAATAVLMVVVVAIPAYIYLRMTKLGDTDA